MSFNNRREKLLCFNHILREATLVEKELKKGTDLYI